MWLVKISRSPYFYARFHAPDGSVVSVSTKQVAKRAAEARGVEIEAEYRKKWDREKGGGSVTSARVIEEYWETEASKRKAARDHIFPHLARIATFLGDKPYCDVTIADVARFADELHGQISNSTINRALSVWRRMHNVAGKKRLYPVHMIDWSEVWLDEPPLRERQLSPDQVKDVLRRLPPHAQEIVIFAVMTGARKTQVLTLEWDRVDLEGRTVTVWRKHRKQNAPHTIDLNDAAFQILVMRRESSTGPMVFDTTNFRKLWDSAIEDCKLEGVRFHDLRHTAGHWLAKKAPLQVVQRLFGHSDIRVTMRYVQAQREDVIAGVSQLPQFSLEKRETMRATTCEEEQPFLNKSNIINVKDDDEQ